MKSLSATKVLLQHKQAKPMKNSTYHPRYPSIVDLKHKAKKQIPGFAFDYVNGGIDEEYGKKRNRNAFHEIELTPRYLTDVSTVDINTEIFGKRYSMAFGSPPIGLGNMMWPGAEAAIARACQSANIPYVLSTFSTTEMEEIAQIAPDVCWFQLYMPNDIEIMKALVKRVKSAGFNTLVITLDIPVGAKRNREIKNGLKLPFSLTADIIWQSLTHPTWAIQTLRHGQPDFVNVLQYRDANSNNGLAEFITSFTQHGVTPERIQLVRELWDGPLVLKGIQSQRDVLESINLGVDGIIVSNHGGRQLDAAPSSIDSLRQLPDEAHNKLTVMLDSGIRTGLDVVRAKALGAQMMFSGRSFFYGVGALGHRGANQVIEIYREEITRTLQQIGCLRFSDVDLSWVNPVKPGNRS